MNKNQIKEKIHLVAFALNIIACILMIVVLFGGQKIIDAANTSDILYVFACFLGVITITGTLVSPVVLGIGYIKGRKNASEYIIISFIIMVIVNFIAVLAFNANYRGFTGTVLYFLIYGICYLIKKDLLLKRKTILWISGCVLFILLAVAYKKVYPIISGASVYKYDEQGNLIYKRDPALQFPYETWYEYENDQRVYEKSVSKDKKEAKTYRYVYDENGNEISMIDDESGEIIRLRVYDSENQLVEEISKSEGTQEFYYNQNGQLIKKINYDGTETEFTYNEMGNPILETCPGKSVMSYQYNEDNVLTFKHKEDSDYIYDWIYFGDGSCKFSYKSKNSKYTHTSFYDKDGNGILYETGSEDYSWGRKCKYYTKYSWWKNGKIKSKKVYTLYKKDV